MHATPINAKQCNAVAIKAIADGQHTHVSAEIMALVQ
jgi:hypothetical protein